MSSEKIPNSFNSIVLNQFNRIMNQEAYCSNFSCCFFDFLVHRLILIDRIHSQQEESYNAIFLILFVSSSKDTPIACIDSFLEKGLILIFDPKRTKDELTA